MARPATDRFSDQGEIKGKDELEENEVKRNRILCQEKLP